MLNGFFRVCLPLLISLDKYEFSAECKYAHRSIGGLIISVVRFVCSQVEHNDDDKNRNEESYVTCF